MIVMFTDTFYMYSTSTELASPTTPTRSLDKVFWNRRNSDPKNMYRYAAISQKSENMHMQVCSLLLQPGITKETNKFSVMACDQTLSMHLVSVVASVCKALPNTRNQC